MSDVQYSPFAIRLRGETVTLTDEEASEIRRSLFDQSIARTEAEEAAAEAAGQVWIASHWHYGTLNEERHYSLRDAAGSLWGIEEADNGSGDSIRCPDGTVHTSDDDWASLADFSGQSSPGLALCL